MAESAPLTLTLLFHNLFLVPPVRLGVGPFKKTVFDPGAHADRCAEYAKTFPGPYDIVALSEVFRPQEYHRLGDAWKDSAASPAAAVAGPGPTGAKSRIMQSSGLATFTSRFHMTRFHTHPYRNVGTLKDGADRLATKGALMVAVDLGDGRELEIASTHLHAGAWTGTVPAPEGSAERIRAEQVTELNQFLHTHHKKDAILLATGDFNIDAGSAADGHLKTAMATLGLADAWEISDQTGPGYTSDLARFTERFPNDPNDERFCIDADPSLGSPDDQVQRIDRWFVPEDDSVRLIRLARRSFPRAADAPNRDKISTLSDHVGLHLEIEIP